MQTIVDQTAVADQQRTQRAFVGFLASALGVDQNYAGEDSSVWNSTQYQNVIANPDGTYSIVGKPTSNVQGQQTAQSASPVIWLAIAFGIYILLK